MDGDAFLEAVRDETNTELSRLGSSKSLYADTGGDMEEEPVLRAIANALHHADETFEDWADAEEGVAGDLFAEATDLAGEQYGVVVGELDRGDYEPADPPAIQEFLGDLETPVERVAGFVGWALVTEQKVGQAVGFFVGQAAPGSADTFREVRGRIEAAVEDGVDALVAIVDGDEAEDLAHDAAVGAIEAAYDEYFQTLEEMGVNPKPVC